MLWVGVKLVLPPALIITVSQLSARVLQQHLHSWPASSHNCSLLHPAFGWRHTHLHSYKVSVFLDPPRGEVEIFRKIKPQDRNDFKSLCCFIVRAVIITVFQFSLTGCLSKEFHISWLAFGLCDWWSKTAITFSPWEYIGWPLWTPVVYRSCFLGSNRWGTK